jgi:uncharacterized protein (TIGR03437 family)
MPKNSSPKDEPMPRLFPLSLLFLLPLTLCAAPQLRLSSLTIGPLPIEAGSNPSPQTINAFNIGDGALNLSASASAAWLTPTILAPGTCSGGPVAACIPITIAFSTATMLPGTYTETVTLNDPNSIDAPQTITVTVQVDGAPTGTLDFYVTPNNGASTAQSDTTLQTVNIGGSVISTVKTSDNGPWLNFVLFGGNQVLFTAYQIRVTAQTGQAEGTYSGMILLSGSIYPADNKTINVNLHVTSQPILVIPAAPITFNLVQGQSPQTYNLAFQNFGLGSLSVSGATSTGGSWLSASPAGGATVAITADPGSLTPGSYFGSVTLASNAANTGVPFPVRVNVSAPANPTVFFNGVVDNAAFAPGQSVGAGSVAAVFGSQLSTSAPAYASGFPLPTTLGGVQVLINGSAVPLFYADANQVDIQIPFTLSTGQVMAQVIRNGQPGNRVSATVDSAAPRLFALRQYPTAPDGTPYGVAINSDGTPALPASFGNGAHPAHRGDILTLYALGLGPVSPSVNTGAPAPATEPLARTVNQVQVTYGGTAGGSVTVNPTYAGLAPNYAGLYQVNVLLPQSAPTGNVPVSITLPGRTSNLVDLAIQ